MADRKVRNTAILAKIETTYGTDPTPTGGANAMLVSNQSVTPLEANLVDRALIRPFLGGSEQIPGTRFKRVQFDVEAVGSGSAGTAPAWGVLLRACGMAETLIASTRADYLPITNLMESATIYYYDDGVLHKLLGARGTFTLNLKQGELPKLTFNFQGIDGGDTAASNPAVTLTNFLTPQAIVDANTADVTFGATCSPTGAPALTGGTAYPSLGIEGLDIGHAVNFQALLGGESVEITDRQAVAKLQIDVTAAQEVSFATTVKDASAISVGLLHGTVVGRKLLVFMPAAQLTNWTKTELNGKRLVGYDLRVNPSAGNDELRIVTSF
jgi:hypothetical protein